MRERTYYEVLMLHPSATQEVIAAAYRVLAKQHHPDYAGPNGAARMAVLNEAYAVLGHRDKRARYDAVLAPSASDASAPASAPARERPSATGTTSQTGAASRTGATGRGRESMPGATNLKYEGGGWAVRPPDQPTPPAPTYGEAGPPPAYLPARGSVISFGRYRGWTIAQVASYDSNYVEWLSRTMGGRAHRAELQQALTQISDQDLANRMRSSRA